MKLGRYTTPRLSGERNQCPVCELPFNSMSAFERHKTGTIGSDRRCRTTDEMRAIGMAVNHAGFWVERLRGTARVPLRPRTETPEGPVADSEGQDTSAAAKSPGDATSASDNIDAVIDQAVRPLK